MSGPNLVEPFQWVVELSNQSALGDLHWLILDLLDFDGDDHLSGFYLANAWGARKTWLLYEYDDTPWERTLEELYPLPRLKKLYYLYDFWVSWIFEIRKQGRGKAPVEGEDYPCVVQAIGSQPMEYPLAGDDDF